MGAKYRGHLARGERVELSFLEAVRTRCPSHGRVLEALGELYTRAGRYHEGLEVDLALTRLSPGEALAWYNLGCSYALVGRRDEAFTALSKAVDLGYRDVLWLLEDADLDALRSDARFDALVRRARRS